MRTLKTAALFIFATATISAQDLKINEVPTHIITEFQKNYTYATDVEWEREGRDYKVEFEVKKKDHEIWYSKAGEIVKSEKEIAATDLPNAVLSVIKSNYKGYKIDGIELTEIDDNTTYEVELEKGWTKELKVVFDSAGKVLSSIAD